MGNERNAAGHPPIQASGRPVWPNTGQANRVRPGAAGDRAAIDKVSEETQRKIDWTKLWGKKYPVLLLYPQQICIEDYAAPLRALLARLQAQAGYSPLDAMLVLKDILAKQWAQ